MRAIVLFFLISGMLTACGGNGDTNKNTLNAESKLQIISSIKPIQAIVVAIAGEHAQSEQLIPDYASPHNYSFKPSDIRKVKNANVIFRIDEHMESQLNAVFEGLDDNIKIISLAEIKEMKLLESEYSHHEDKHGSDANDKHEEHDGHSGSGTQHDSDEMVAINFHIWTSPKNAIIIAREVTKTLSALDSKNAKHYQQNFETFSQSLTVESKNISALLAKNQDTKYIVFHNSWQYFASEFGLQKPIVIDLHEGISSGAKTVKKIQKIIVDENIRCVFYDSSVNKARLALITETTQATEIDVLATGIEMTQSAYINWLTQLSQQIGSCLSTQ